MDVSIIITNHNYGRFLGRAIQSCQAQKMPEDAYEIIVVDDASTDNSMTVLDAYQARVEVISQEERTGLPGAINTGIRQSRGQYVVRLDADDWLDRHACAFMSYFLHHNKEIGFVWPDYYVMDDFERVTGRISTPQGAGVMFRKQLLVDIGLYDEEMLVHEDKDILLRCIDRFPGYHLKMPLYRYYRHGANMTDRREEADRYYGRLTEKHGQEKLDTTFTTDPGGWPPLAGAGGAE